MSLGAKKFIICAFILWLSLYMALPSADSFISPRFLFSYLFVVIAGSVTSFLAFKGVLTMPVWLPVTLTSYMAVCMPLVKMYFS